MIGVIIVKYLQSQRPCVISQPSHTWPGLDLTPRELNKKRKAGTN